MFDLIALQFHKHGTILAFRQVMFEKKQSLIFTFTRNQYFRTIIKLPLSEQQIEMKPINHRKLFQLSFVETFRIFHFTNPD